MRRQDLRPGAGQWADIRRPLLPSRGISLPSSPQRASVAGVWEQFSRSRERDSGPPSPTPALELGQNEPATAPQKSLRMPVLARGPPSPTAGSPDNVFV